MIRTFQVDYVRSALELALRKNRKDTENYFCDNDFDIFSFYEHLEEDQEVERYVEKYQTLIDRQNKQDIVGFGIVSVSNTPSLINNADYFVSPFEWACTIRVNMENRDKVIQTIYKVMEDFRGRKIDIATFDNGKLLSVGTIGNNRTNNIVDYDFIGEIDGEITSTKINYKLAELLGSYSFVCNGEYLYLENNGKLYLVKKIADSFDWEIVEDFIPQHNSFEKMKLDLSLTDVKVNEPYNLNASEYCEITFGGGATLTSHKVRVGNDLVRLYISKNKVICSNDGQGDFIFTNPTKYLLDPIEKGAGNSANTIENKLRSNFFTANSHTDSVAITHEYTFIYDCENQLLNDWFEYACYGDCKLGANNVLQQTSMTPNIIYNVKEIYNTWATFKVYEYKAKIVEEMDIGETDSDVQTIKVAFQLQGDNN